MEGSEELTSLPKPHTVTDEEKHTPSPPREHHHHQQQQQLGLGFQPSLSVDPDQNLDHAPPPPPPPPPPDDLDRQTTDEERQNQQPISEELGNLQPVNDEFRNQQTVSEECRNQQPVNAEFQNQQTVSEELQNQQATDEEFQNLVNQELQTQKPIREEFLNQQPVNEEFQNQQTVSGELQNINEELQNLVLKEKEKVSEKGVHHEDDVDGAQSEADEKGDREVDVEGEERNENDDAKGEEGIDDDDDSRSENEEDDNGNENVGGETALVAGSKDGICTRYHFPLKPDAEDCSYYMRTGMCKFGSNCKFNHPPKMKNQAPKEKEENPDRPGHTECKYYLRSGGCKFGKACRYNHSRGKIPVAPVVEFNFLGLPIRPGERECPYYMRNGSCKYESNCRFNHPDPTAVGGGNASSGYGNGGPDSLQGASQSTISSWSPPRALNETPFVPGMFSPTQGVPSSNLEWNGYQAPVYPTPVGSLPTPPAFLNSPVDTEFYTHHKQQMLVEEFPERPGQPECSYFLKTGDCKYRSGCKFHHPKNRMPKTATLALSDKGLPLRPDQNICSHYNLYGICKFGPACKFDHPVNYGRSDSSAVSGPDKPSPFGNSATADCGWR